MKKVKILLFTTVVFLISCKKWGNGYVEGHIYENGTNEPIKNMRVNFYSEHYGNTGEALGDVYTNENGYYKISYHNKLSKSWTYYLYVRNDGYTGKSIKWVENKKEKVDFYFDPMAYVKFHIINNTTADHLVIINSDVNTSTYMTSVQNSDQIYSNVLGVKSNGTTKITWQYDSYSNYDYVTINTKNDTITYTITIN